MSHLRFYLSLIGQTFILFDQWEINKVHSATITDNFNRSNRIKFSFKSSQLNLYKNQSIFCWYLCLKTLNLCHKLIFFIYIYIRKSQFVANTQFLYILRKQGPNLKNLSRGLNLRRGSNMVVPLKIVLNVSCFKPVLNRNRFLADLRRGSNSLNSDSGKLAKHFFCNKVFRVCCFYIIMNC